MEQEGIPDTDPRNGARVNIEEGVPLAPLTTLRLGGAARYLARCASVDDLREALSWAAARHLPVHVLGGGSNTVFADAGFDGLVVHVDLAGVRVETAGAHANVTAAGGEDWDGLVARCVEAGLTGVECLSGIPGRVGATPMQNVGAYGQEVAETIVEVRAVERGSLEMVTFAGADCGFAYRDSRFKGVDRDRYVITEVVYRLRCGGHPEVRYAELARRLEADGVDLRALAPGRAAAAVRDAVLAVRRGKSMVADPADPNARSAGSFFLNPTVDDATLARLRDRWRAAGGDDEVPAFPAGEGRHKVPAAWLVERAGFPRGTRRGDAAISDQHALALVARGDRAADLLSLAAAVAAAVRDRFGIDLTREPVVVPARPVAA